MKILIADDHSIVREGIILLLAEAFPFGEISAVSDAVELMKLVHKQKWDVIICDISMPPGDSGLEATKQIKEYSPKTPVIILSMHASEVYGVRSIRAGAMGYLTKAAAAKELVNAINCVLSGRKYLSTEMAEAMADSIELGNKLQTVEGLSDREFEVFKLLASGKSVSEIAKLLILSANTVSTYHARIFQKMGFHTNMELIKHAVENNVI